MAEPTTHVVNLDERVHPHFAWAHSATAPLEPSLPNEERTVFPVQQKSRKRGLSVSVGERGVRLKTKKVRKTIKTHKQTSKKFRYLSSSEEKADVLSFSDESAIRVQSHVRFFYR